MCACVLARCDVKAEGAAGLRANKANNRPASMRLQFAGRRARPMNPCKEDPFQEHGPSARPGACTITPSVCGYLQAMGNPQAAERGESMATMEAKVLEGVLGTERTTARVPRTSGWRPTCSAAQRQRRA